MPYFRRWDELVGAGDCGFVVAGYLRLEPPERAEYLRRCVALLQLLGVATGIIPPNDVAHLAPYLQTDDIAVAAFEPESGYADANGTLDGFIEAARRRGGEVRTATPVLGVRTAGGAVRGVETPSGPINAPIVVLVAGVWTAGLLRPLGLDLPVTGPLTQWLGSELPTGCQSPALTVGEGTGQSYVRALSPGASRVLFGLGGSWRRPLGEPAAVEAPIPAETVVAAHERLTVRLQGSAGARYTGGRSGPIGVTPGDLAIIDAHPGVRGLYYFVGDCGSSFRTAPAGGRALAERAAGLWPSGRSKGRPRLANVSAFRLDRFAAESRDARRSESGDDERSNP